MSQHDYNIANGGGAAVRADINAALLAILSQNSGATAPATTKPFMLWYDTANSVLKQRNAADSAWGIVPFTFDASGNVTAAADLTVASAATRKVSVNRTNASTAGAIEMISGDSQNVLSSTGAKDIGVEINGTEILRFKSGGGIKFPATQLASSDANTLDDYEEGTWTPVIASSGTQPTTSSVSAQGYYTKIGNIVTVTCSINATMTSAGTGYPRVTGFPFAKGGTSYQAASIGFRNLFSSILDYDARISSGGSSLDFPNSTTWQSSGNNNLTFFITYQVA